MAIDEKPWWVGGTIYHIYLRSWVDGNGDGVGDLYGAREQLGYLAWLGVDAVWLSPTMPSPNTDWGYDVSDYLGVHPEFGDRVALEAFVSDARAHDLAVVLDLVPNHSSDQHAWFIEAVEHPDSNKHEYYVWASGTDDGHPPNNWVDATGSSAWTWHPTVGKYYLHNFLQSQPDLNWWCDEVHAEFESILRFWFDLGIAGFRIDVAHGLYKDVDLRDDPPTTDLRDLSSHFGLVEAFSKNRPEVHQVYRAWRALAEQYDPPRLLLGETWTNDFDRWADFFGSNDELQLAFNFRFFFAPFRAPALAEVVDETLKRVPQGCTTVWSASNHDVSRFPTRWCENRPERGRAAMVLLTTLPGTLVLYYGDELGLGDVELAPDELRDPMTAGVAGASFLRDRARTPMVWEPDGNRGFTRDDATPWLPIRRDPGVDVHSQQENLFSHLHLTRSLLALRRRFDLSDPRSYRLLSVDDTHWSFAVGDLLVLANLSDEPRDHATSGEIVLSSNPRSSLGLGGGDSELLAPWEVVVEVSARS
ncbi:MAG: alpha-amylase family glycosyl hydrolase [Acidimicrobiales bacterium]